MVAELQPVNRPQPACRLAKRGASVSSIGGTEATRMTRLHGMLVLMLVLATALGFALVSSAAPAQQYRVYAK
jgi:hypothetical protein